MKPFRKFSTNMAVAFALMMITVHIYPMVPAQAASVITEAAGSSQQVEQAGVSQNLYQAEAGQDAAAQAKAVSYTSGDWTYEVSNGEATITDYNGSDRYITIPDRIDGYKVTALGVQAISTGSSSYKTLGVTLPDSLREIGEKAFYGCYNLKEIVWGTGLKTIGRAAFSYCHGLKSLSIPEGVTEIGEEAFNGCSYVKTLRVPSTVREIGTSAFMNLAELEVLYFNAVDCEVGEDLFSSSGWENKFRVVFGDTVKKIPARLFFVEGHQYDVSAVDISDSVASIGEYAFASCWYLTELKLGKGLRSIGSYAFTCGVTEIRLPEGLETVGDHIFFKCRNLNTVVFPESLASTNPLISECEKLTRVVVYNKTMEGFLAEDSYDDETVTVYCHPGSAADTYAQGYDCKIKYLDRDHYFPDVPPTHNYQIPVYWAVDRGIAAGYKNGNFGVADTVTRGQVAMFLWRAAGRPAPKGTTQTFQDVPVTHNYYKAIQWAYEQGITGGYTGRKAGKFGPKDFCKRGQIATFLWRYAGKPEPEGNEETFPDVPTTHNYYKAIQWAYEQGITAGYPDGSFRSDISCTRGHCVTFMYRLLGGEEQVGVEGNPWE